MKFSRPVLLLAIISTILFSCSKEKSYEIPDANSGIYLPHTTDATWHYEDTLNQIGFTLKATDRIDSINKIRFFIYENIPDDDTQDTSYTLIGKAGYNYYVSGLLPQLGDKMLMILKQDAVVGEIWSQRIGLSDSDSLDMVFQIKEKGISHVVYGESYSEVIHVGISAKISLGVGTEATFTVPVGDLYFAKGIGIIELNLDFQDQIPSVNLLLTDFSSP